MSEPTLEELLARYPAPFRSPLEKALVAEVERLRKIAGFAECRSDCAAWKGGACDCRFAEASGQ